VIVVYNALAVRPGVADGAATFSVNILPELAAALGDAEVVALVRPGEHRIEQAPNLSVRPVPSAGTLGGRLRFELFALKRTVRRLGADVVVLPSELVLGRSIRTVVVAQNLAYHCPQAQAFRGGTLPDRISSRLQTAYYRTVMPIAYARAARVAAVSETAAELLGRRAGLDASKTRVIYEGSDSRLLPGPIAGAVRESRVLIVSALSPYKDLERSLRLFALVKHSLPALQLDVVGSSWRGFGDVLRREAADLGIGSSVRFHGTLTGDALADLYQRASVLLHFSHCESFGLPVVEAMRYGLPVAAALRSSVGELAAGAVLPLADDDAAAAKAIVDLLRDERARTALAERGTQRAAELTWRAAAERLAVVVREAAAA
jgi:glycosyltransferase involved in cell wall biosynthesis